jgi:small subunit ribosomal protein S13
MARIAGINIPLNKRVEIGLTYIFGIGRSSAREIVKKAGVDADTYVKDLTDDEVLKLREAIDEELNVEGDLRTRKGPRKMSVAGKKKVKK